MKSIMSLIRLGIVELRSIHFMGGTNRHYRMYEWHSRC